MIKEFEDKIENILETKELKSNNSLENSLDNENENFLTLKNVEGNINLSFKGIFSLYLKISKKY